MVFCEASIEQIRTVVACLICFETITGLKVNLHKSSLFPVGTVPEIGVFAETVGCQLAELPTTYLGFLIGARSFNSAIWDPVISKVEKKVQNWKAKFLSFGGRVTLLKSVLSGLPIYFMSLLKAHVSVIKKLESLQNNFMWAGDLQEKKLHWVAWEVVKAPRGSGGLGIQDLKIMNNALLGKWAWRFAVVRVAWWRALIVTKCGAGRSDWYASWNEGSAGCSMWRWIVYSNSVFWRHGFLDPGGGLCDFWFDHWVRGGEVVCVFPEDCGCCPIFDFLCL
ncbi:Putative ribonuclease H protein At1g65750 [Linum perenne]